MMPGDPDRRRWQRAAGWTPLLVAVGLLALLATLRPGPERLWGDEGTFLAMTASLVRDGDLAFDERDREWAEERSAGEGVTVILQRVDGGISYSKPVLYPLLAAPFYLVAGEAGLYLLNLLALAAALALAWRALRPLGPPGRVAVALSSFAAAGALLPYLGWRMSDLLQAAMALAGLALACGGLRATAGGGRRTAVGIGGAIAAGLLLGLAAAMRMPNAALAAGATGANLAVGRRRRAVALLAAAVLAFGLAAGLGQALTGAANPYKALRTSFNAAIGYPVGADGEHAAERFSTQTNTSRIGLVPAAEPRQIGYAALYYLIGRHTGLVAFFPAALLLTAIALRRPDRVATALLLTAAVMAGFYVVWIPWNYFGGSTFVGNRYFLTIYPALLIALPRLPRPREWIPVWGIALVVAVSALFSVARAGELDPWSQSHASAGIFRVLPYESTARRIDGGRDRYWADDFVRFVDPFSDPSEYAFTLESDRPPAELLVATAGTAGRIVLLATAEKPGVEISFSDWGRDATYRLEPAGGGSRSLISLAPSPVWRRHRFWWNDEVAYRARTLRLGVRGQDGGPAAVELRYLGDGRLLRRRPAARLEGGELPTKARAGTRTAVELRLHNSGDWAWESEAIVPVELGYRLFRGSRAKPADDRRQPLTERVEAGAETTAKLEIVWPKEPGNYRLVVDLVRLGIGWFADRTGQPLAQVTVRVVADPDGDADRLR